MSRVATLLALFICCLASQTTGRLFGGALSEADKQSGLAEGSSAASRRQLLGKKDRSYKDGQPVPLWASKVWTASGDGSK